MANRTLAQLGFHARTDAARQDLAALRTRQTVRFDYTLETFFHPFVGELIQELNRAAFEGMLDPDFHQSLADSQFFDASYATHANDPAFKEAHKSTAKLVAVTPPTKAIELKYERPYAIYNWEMLFHIPLAVAAHLSKNQRFADAQRWFHFIFDPTSNDVSVPAPQRYWKFLAFRNGDDPTHIDKLLDSLSTSTPNEDRKAILDGYEAIRNNPFQPHAVARTRLVAYQYAVVMKYLDNLIAWGDHLFRQDTVETLNEATPRYMLAANLLGERPERVPRPGSVRPKTFAELKAGGLDALSNALVELESLFPLNLSLPPAQAPAAARAAAAVTPLFGIGRTLYFCVPHNEKLLGYWDTVADRLFKIRNCLNIEGIFRQLPLFDPPLDPGMLVKATAAGIDVRTVVNGLNQPVGPLRCAFLIQKALELVGEVRGMGSSLLAAIEKGDGERMALLRQGHELQLQQIAKEVRFLQKKNAAEATEALLRSRAVALERYLFYRCLLDLKTDSAVVPETLTANRKDLTEANFDEVYQELVGQYAGAVPEQPHAPIVRPPQVLTALFSGATFGDLHLNLHEFMDLNVFGPLATLFRLLSSTTDTVSGVTALLPDAYVDGQPLGVGGHSRVAGGDKVAASGRSVSSSATTLATMADFAGAYTSKVAGYQRRTDEWTLQHNLAARELMQIGRQLISSLIAEQVAEHEYRSLQKQVDQSQEVDRFLHEKFTNAELFAWMQGELTRLYYEYYRFAFDTARKAEAAMKFELMRPEVDGTNFVKFNYWDGGRKGLLSGDALYLDVKRMELAYHENNRREYELTKHISLRQLNPLALLALKATGACEVTLPEWLFDLDGPGHYLRRIKHVALSIPCVTGPYSSVNCTLTLLKSSLRKSPALDVDYPRQPSDDSRFIDNFGAIQSIVTSNGREDGGLFETNLRDERFLPFEGAGAESTWRLELPAEFRQFDYDTISDVILHLRYTARQGGDPLKGAAVKNLQDILAEANTAGLALLFSLKHDFPNAWSAFVHGDKDFTATIRRDDFPYFTQGREITIIALEIYDGEDVSKHHTVGDPESATTDLKSKEAFTLTVKEDTAEPKVLTRTAEKEVFLIVSYALP